MARESLRFLNSAIGKGIVAAIVVGTIVIWLMGRRAQPHSCVTVARSARARRPLPR